MHADAELNKKTMDAELDAEPSCLADLNDDLLRKIASRLAESDLASAVALKRCSSHFKDLATPLVANAVSRINTKWRDAADKIGEEGAARIRGGLERNGVLTTLNLLGNNIRAEGAAAIAEALRGNGVLTDLNLLDNNIGGETGYIKASEVEGESKEVGATVIYQGREMVVSKGVDSDGDLKLVDAVQTGVLAIAKALEVNGVLTTLNLGRNKIGDEGGVAIAEALRVNGVLNELNISRNQSSTCRSCAAPTRSNPSSSQASGSDPPRPS